MKAKIEYTDTWGKELNYSWVQRGSVEGRDMRELVRRAKREMGLTGVICDREDWGDVVVLRPRSWCTALVIEIIEG